MIDRMAEKQEEGGRFVIPNWAATHARTFWYQRLSIALQRYTAFKLLDLNRAVFAAPGEN